MPDDIIRIKVGDRFYERTMVPMWVEKTVNIGGGPDYRKTVDGFDGQKVDDSVVHFLNAFAEAAGTPREWPDDD